MAANPLGDLDRLRPPSKTLADALVRNQPAGLLPDDVAALLQRQLVDPSSPLQHARRNAAALAASVATSLAPVVAPLVARVERMIASSPDLVVLALFAAVVFFVVQLLSYAQRVMLFWTRLALRAVFWSGVAALVAFVWQRGVETSMRDAAVLTSRLIGFAASAKDIFINEYRRYEEMERAKGRI